MASPSGEGAVIFTRNMQEPGLIETITPVAARCIRSCMRRAGSTDESEVTICTTILYPSLQKERDQDRLCDERGRWKMIGGEPSLRASLRAYIHVLCTASAKCLFKVNDTP